MSRPIITLSTKYLPNEKIRVRIGSFTGEYTLEAWANRTDSAIAVRDRAVAENRRPQTDAERNAALWLHAAKLTTAAQIEEYKKRRALLRGGGDLGKLVRCKICGRKLSDPLSKLVGVGTHCRRKG